MSDLLDASKVWLHVRMICYNRAAGKENGAFTLLKIGPEVDMHTKVALLKE